MTRQEFLEIKEEIINFKYSSMKYTDYDEVENFKIVLQNKNIILIYGYNNESKIYQYHWAANDEQVLISAIETQNDNFLITFIPDEFVLGLENAGLKVWAKWNDYFKDTLEDVNCDFKYEFLNQIDAEVASEVTRSCKGRSRGFAGQTTEWIKSWLNGTEAISTGTKNNTIIISRNSLGEIVGLVCTATYAHDSQKGPIVWAREVVVRPEYQKMGIGRKLVTQALSYGKEKGAVRGFLQADECNIYAIHLYESLGFVSNKYEAQIDMFKASENK
ncbi:GNAT family N-acetyltransferase [Clostridium sp.]|uniref:GNAT family N-acetyltransferase n=1 Tax=Clostridium sp. TaxID=1506 RepID=UPI003463E71F